jgi:hypothetical protein
MQIDLSGKTDSKRVLRLLAIPRTRAGSDARAVCWHGRIFGSPTVWRSIRNEVDKNCALGWDDKFTQSPGMSELNQAEFLLVTQ